MTGLHEQCGDCATFTEGASQLHFVFSPQLNRELLTQPENFHSSFFAVRGSRSSAQRRLTSGLLSMNGQQHKQSRRTVQTVFQRQAIQGYLPTIQRFTEEMLDSWQTRREINLCREMTELMLRVTSTVLFGLSDHDSAFEIGRMIDEWVHLNHEIGIGALVSDVGISEQYAELLGFAERLEVEIAQLILHRRSDTSDRHDVLSMLQGAHESSGNLGAEELIGQTALIFAAAHLTTAHSLTWGLFLLAQHPSVMQRVWKEFHAHLHDGFPSPEEVARLVECELALKESMRILPASAYSQRIATVATQLGGMSLPKYSVVIFSQYITHRRREFYADPAAYIPHRWAALSPSPYAYLPFGAGSRMCVGGPLAMLILKTAIPTILQRYKLTMVPHSDVSGRVVSTMLSPSGPIWMRLSSPDGRFTAEPVTGNIHSLIDLREVRRRRAAA
ncbi:MAG TPA: cytochrome P450 [Planctomycetaceae bacterium]|nr:cytochrome P450 [Planctomycetaceae bacterium]